MQVDDNKDIAKEIETIKERLAELEQEQKVLIARKEALTRSNTFQLGPSEYSNLSTNQKVELFARLFKGRSDIYATRWQNSKGRSGYSVTCYNEWKQGICNKPNTKCGECTNRKYKALDHQAIYKHLSGKHVIGIYPLLQDNKCQILAVDFDKTGWRSAVKAMAQACVEYKIPHAIEISRSGDGAHLWIFFSQPVFARDVRLLGFGLLDKAMEIYPTLSFESYDRLFPNQDLMPEGGFGNLIALPLQYSARQQGNSQFVDNYMIPYPNQWEFLSQLEKVSSEQLDNYLTQITPKNTAINDDSLPWEQGLAVKNTIIKDCPTKITIILANHIYFKLDDLPSLLIARLKRLSSFSNPVFFKTQALRFSTHGIPRYISCARIEQGYLSLPRGCFDEAMELLKEQNIIVVLDDKRFLGKKLDSLSFLGKLRKDQTKAVNVMTKYNTGVLHAPTAFGKTITAIGIIHKRSTNTLILTHSRQILEQWQQRLKSFLNGAKIGIFCGGKKKPSGCIDIATYQSLINKKDNSVNPIIQEYGQVIIDECHHISAPRFEMVLNEVRSKFVLGLTATPERQDGHQKIIFMIAGPVRHKVTSNHTDSFELLVKVTQLYHPLPDYLINSDNRHKISDVYHWLIEDNERSQKIVNDAASEISKGKHPLVLTERREHAELINQMLKHKGFQTVLLKGAMRAKERKAANEQLATAQVIVATGKFVGEGFDLPRLDTLFLALPISWKGLLIQYAGRIHRESAGKDCISIFDYVDSSLPMLQRMYRKREKGYKAMGYQITYIDNHASAELS